MNLNDLKQEFLKRFGGDDKDIRFFTSPGRVNLIGEHTDYNGGFVFPAALSMNTTIVARPRNDGILRMQATDLDIKVEGSLLEIEKYKDLEWGNYQFGVASELMKAGYNVIGADMLYHDTIPHGGGLSSSAAIEVATAIAMVMLGGGQAPDGVEMAKIGQKAENNYIGVNCGIMDQFASAMGKKNHAIFLNCKDLSFKLVPLALDGMKIVISNTNKKRSLAASKYNERRSECEIGFEILKKALPNATCLGDVTYEEFEANKYLIENETVRKRVAHVISEDDRVLKSVEALNKGDIVKFGELMTASHHSLRDLYEVTGEELDTLVEEALKIDGVLGSRMTGAGFGGCTVSIVKNEAVDEFIKCVGEAYERRIGYKASFYVSEVDDGGREVFI
ncbi:MAG: galactokinase [Clostridia bacterium]|nr:galactokinase [Clostridia bacterium]